MPGAEVIGGVDIGGSGRATGGSLLPELLEPPLIEEASGPEPGPEPGPSAPTVAKPPNKQALVGVAIAPWSVVATNATVFLQSGLPPGLSLNASTGVISGTPSAIAGSSQEFPVTITVEGTGGTASASFTYTVAQLAIVNPGPQVLVLGEAASVQLVAPLATSFSAVGLPPGLTLNPATGLISGSPTEVGTVTSTVTAHAAAETASAPIEWTIEATEFVLSPLALDMLGELPPVLRSSRDYQAVMQALAKEGERAGGLLEAVRAQFFPGRADLLLNVWEAITRLPVSPPGLSLAERRAAVEAALLKLLSGGEGREWVALVTATAGPGWSYAEHDPADPSSPAPNVLLITLPFSVEDARFQQVVRLLEEATPAHLTLQYATAGGFLLDESEMDADTFAV